MYTCRDIRNSHLHVECKNLINNMYLHCILFHFSRLWMGRISTMAAVHCALTSPNWVHSLLNSTMRKLGNWVYCILVFYMCLNWSNFVISLSTVWYDFSRVMPEMKCWSMTSIWTKASVYRFERCWTKVHSLSDSDCYSMVSTCISWLV